MRAPKRVDQRHIDNKVLLEPPFMPELTGTKNPDFPLQISARAARALYWHLFNIPGAAMGLRFYNNDGWPSFEYCDVATLSPRDYLISKCNSIPLAMDADEAELFSACFLDRQSYRPGPPRLTIEFKQPEMMFLHDQSRLKLSLEKLALLHPELFLPGGFLARFVAPLIWVTSTFGSQPEDKSWINLWLGVHDPVGQQAAIDGLARMLWYHDPNPAIVLSEEPLIVAAYSDVFDHVMLLRLPDWLADPDETEKPLKRNDRLVTVNAYFDYHDPPNEMPRGPNPKSGWNDIWCLIGDLLSDDQVRLNALKAEIPETRWQQCRKQGLERIDAGHDWRDGRPWFSRTPISWQKSGYWRIRGGYLT